MRARHGITVVDLAAVVAVVGLGAGLLMPGAVTREQWKRLQDREVDMAVKCRRQLNQIAKGMATYLNEHGDNRFYPCPLGRGRARGDYNGAEWLASLYWTGVIPDPSIFICPRTKDTNRKGRDLGTHHAIKKLFGSQTVSYAAMHYRSLTNRSGKPVGGAIRDDYPPNMPMASDDTQGTINHGPRTVEGQIYWPGGINILFVDSHVEHKRENDVSFRNSVGRKPGLLWQLRN